MPVYYLKVVRFLQRSVNADVSTGVNADGGEWRIFIANSLAEAVQSAEEANYGVIEHTQSLAEATAKHRKGK